MTKNPFTKVLTSKIATKTALFRSKNPIINAKSVKLTSTIQTLKFLSTALPKNINQSKQYDPNQIHHMPIGCSAFESFVILRRVVSVFRVVKKMK